MSAIPQQHPEEIFEGRGVEIHIAPEGLALTMKRRIPDAPDQYVAEYGEVHETRIEGGARAQLVVEFGPSRPAWCVRGMRRAHAEWAKRAIDQNVRRARRRALPLHSTSLPVAKIVEEVEALLRQTPLDIPELAHALLAQAALHEASDVHFSPTPESMTIRWRTDGMLHNVCQFAPGIGKRVVSRLKVLAGLASYQHNVIQEGRFSLELKSTVEFRLTVMPTLHGETATVRTFDPSRGLMQLDDLGFEPDDLALYRDMIAGPSGLIVLTGPAGAGKTTTMYASMRGLDAQSEGALSFATVEEPVEYDLGFASQTAVDPEADLTFANGLRTVLRQDPNVIMVGEIRDPETAEIATRAGMTGHLIFTTLHASGAGGVFPRLAEMDVAPFLSTSALRCIVAQRLLPRLCECATPAQPEPDLLASLGLAQSTFSGWELRSPQGCEKCDGTGYAGRIGILQVTPVSDELRDLAMRQASAPEIDDKMRALGVPTLHALALQKAQRGIISLEDVLRTLGRTR